MAATVSDFAGQRVLFAKRICNLLDGNEVTQLQPELTDFPNSSDADKKAALDQAFRDVLKDQFVKDSPTHVYTSLVNIAMLAVSQLPDLCSHQTPFMMLSDVFDTTALDKCDEVFTFVEERVPTWKSETFYNAGKNYLLRMSNDLLRRLSKSQNTVFCGRIQLFLARLFPLDEKSGLNLMSQFNLDNLTVFSTAASDDKFRRISAEDKLDESMDIEEGEMDELSSSIPVDYNLYCRFWSLQDYFRKPSQCYEKVSWKKFVQNADEVLRAFTSYKLDDMKSSRRRLENLRQSKQAQSFFAKFLTSEKLLDLQLSDSNFRRYVLVQFLILFQYLSASVKFKSASFNLQEDQTSWMKPTTDAVYKLLRETPPNGEEFCKTVGHILSREENWNNWKNEGCPTFVRERASSEVKPQLARGRKRSMADDMRHCGKKLIKMGSSELTRLWNLCPDNMAACKAEKRVFLPNGEIFFEEAILQADPEQMVEDEYKVVNEENFQWRSLRLLARSNPHFFAMVTQPGKKVSEYLDIVLKKIVRDLPQNADVNKVENGDADKEETEKENEDELLNKADDSEKDVEGDTTMETQQEEVITIEQIESLATELANDWKKLAMELNLQEDEISYFESETEDLSQQALRMLTIWKETEGERATPSTLRTSLKEVGLVEVGNKVFGEQNGA